MKIKSSNILILLFISNTSYATEPTLCKKNENIYFSCKAGKKVISVCTSNDKIENGYLAYRYGKSPSNIELEYSSSYKSINDKFKFSLSGYAKGGTNELAFKISQYTYTVNADSHVYRPDSSGVYIEKK